MKSGKPNSAERGGPPTDLDLMLYVDGELDGVRCREVEAHLARDASYRAKLTGLEVAAGMVREDALGSAFADGIADAVMARIERGDAKDGNGAGARPLAMDDLVRDATRPSNTQRLAPKPANDNARGIFALAAVAVAAAAAMMIWGRMQADPTRTASTVPAPVETVAAPPPAVAEPATRTERAEAELGVEVAAVDFGARIGTIFYVPQGSAASSPTTTVVWLSDDVPGGQQ
jgi:hypothetical protein